MNPTDNISPDFVLAVVQVGLLEPHQNVGSHWKDGRKGGETGETNSAHNELYRTSPHQLFTHSLTHFCMRWLEQDYGQG